MDQQTQAIRATVFERKFAMKKLMELSPLAKSLSGSRFETR